MQRHSAISGKDERDLCGHCINWSSTILNFLAFLTSLSIVCLAIAFRVSPLLDDALGIDRSSCASNLDLIPRCAKPISVFYCENEEHVFTIAYALIGAGLGLVVLSVVAFLGNCFTKWAPLGVVCTLQFTIVFACSALIGYLIITQEANQRRAEAEFGRILLAGANTSMIPDFGPNHACEFWHRVEHALECCRIEGTEFQAAWKKVAMCQNRSVAHCSERAVAVGTCRKVFWEKMNRALYALLVGAVVVVAVLAFAAVFNCMLCFETRRRRQRRAAPPRRKPTPGVRFQEYRPLGRPISAQRSSNRSQKYEL